MADRLDRARAALRLRDKMLVMPPWPHEDHIVPVGSRTSSPASAERPTGNPFRVRHGLAGKFVVMYSGNHSPSNPLTTLLRRGRPPQGRPGPALPVRRRRHRKKEVEAVIREHGLTNAMSLPYQPLSGSAPFAVGRRRARRFARAGDGRHHPPVQGLRRDGRRPADPLFRPAPSHITDLLDAHPFGRASPHGDVDGAVGRHRRTGSHRPGSADDMGRVARAVLRGALARDCCAPASAIGWSWRSMGNRPVRHVQRPLFLERRKGLSATSDRFYSLSLYPGRG